MTETGQEGRIAADVFELHSGRLGEFISPSSLGLVYLTHQTVGFVSMLKSFRLAKHVLRTVIYVPDDF